MNNPAQIAFIFPTYKRPEEVIFNLSFFRENIALPYEVFILDNSPKRMKYDFRENEHYIFFGQNKGTAARNIGIQQTSAPVCLLLDDDSHPLPGTVELLLDQFQTISKDCAGIICPIDNPDGGQEASLLPTVFHGAGVAFRTATLIQYSLFYPDFCFYGEEYRLSAEIYKAGFYLYSLPEARVMHRRSDKERDLSKIFYYLGRNNTAIWEDIVPEIYRQRVIYDSHRRYELTSKKEDVFDSYEKGRAEPLGRSQLTQMGIDEFKKFALINDFEKIETSSPLILAGTGKFPTLWANILAAKGFRVSLADFNPGLIGQSFGEYNVLSPEDAITQDSLFILGHSSTLDTARWKGFLTINQKETIDLSDSH